MTSNPERFTTDEKEVRMLGPVIRTVNRLTAAERAENDAHDAALAKIKAALRESVGEG